MASAGRVLERIAVAAGLAVVAVALSVALLTAPWFTRVATTRLDVASQTGLSHGRTMEVAEEVRRFVTDANAPSLPAEVDGRSGFDETAADHLIDVRIVVLALRRVSIAIAAALVIWLVLSVRAGRRRQVASGLRWGGIACLALPAALALVGLFDFESLFVSFHGVFFEPGTWSFPADSLLIELFPERFWMAAAGALAFLVVIQGVALWFVGRLLRNDAHPRSGLENRSPA